MKVYKIVKYDLIDKELFTCQEMPELEMRENGKYKQYFYNGTNEEYTKSHLWELSITPKSNALPVTEKLMPYFADVTEDVSGRYKQFATTYRDCQLMTERHGGYLQFWHEETKQVLRIAFNSNYYTPIEK